MTAPRRNVSLVLPIKETSWAKSRIDVPVATRQRVAAALARHSLEVATRSLHPSQVFVVTSDDGTRELADNLGAHVVPDPGKGLNSAVEHGIRFARSRQPHLGVVVMVSDLPEVEVSTLERFFDALDRPASPAQYVADRSGSGTTAIFCPPGSSTQMVFGPHSAARFERLGWSRMDDVPVELRADLDTFADLLAVQSAPTITWLHAAAGLATIGSA